MDQDIVGEDVTNEVLYCKYPVYKCCNGMGNLPA